MENIIKRRVIQEGLISSNNYLEYIALISQTGTSDPTVIILNNTIGSIVWTRQSTGLYRGTLIGAFTLNKTFQLISPSSPVFFNFNSSSADQVYIQTQDLTGTSTDSALGNNSILIRVYN